MKLFIFLSIIAVVYGRSIEETEEHDCDGILVNGQYLYKEVLKTDLDRPYLLAVDQGTNTLYFSYSLDGEKDEFQSAYIKLDTNYFQIIENIKDGFTQTIDQKTHDVYIGGSDGIYKYDPNTKTAKHFAADNKDIWMVYFKENTLYYSEFPSQFLYTHQKGVTARFKDLEDTKVDHMIIDNDNNIFFTNDTGLYAQKQGSKDAVAYSEKISGVRGLTTDNTGHPYACLEDGIYKIVQSETKLEKIADIEDAFGLAFDSKNNIIYADANTLYRLTANKRIICSQNNS